MGYLQIPGGIPGFSKGVISFWFRIPAASLAAAQAQFLATWSNTGVYDYNLNGMVPLLCFGGAGTFTETPDGDFNLGCSFIGVNCGEYSKFNNGALVTAPHLVAKLQYLTCEAIGTDLSTSGNGGDGFPIGYDPPGLPTTSSVVTPLHIPVSADTWHHVLVSFDMSTPSTSTGSLSGLVFTSACKFWWSFDDQNYNSAYLWPSWNGCYPGNGGAGVNDVGAAWNKYFSNGVIGLNQSFSAGNLPTSGHPLGAPAAATADISHIFKVEMAELQVFCGVTLDTGVELNRRAFITSTADPANMSLSEALLGQAPDIKLHGSNNWKAGLNTGSLGTTLDPTGAITAYTPNPGH